MNILNNNNIILNHILCIPDRDLSHNEITGKIPKLPGTLTRM